MAVERTFSILKPDATARNLTGAINAMIEQAGLRIIAQKRVQITKAQAEQFYGVHKARPFFGELVEFMISAPVVVQVLEGEGAILKYRDVMGPRPPPTRSARFTPSRSARTPCTAQIPPRTPRSKSRSSSPATKSSASINGADRPIRRPAAAY